MVNFEYRNPPPGQSEASGPEKCPEIVADAGFSLLASDHAQVSVCDCHAALAILLSAMAGGVFGRSALATEDLPDHYKTLPPRSTRSRQLRGPVESDRLVYGAINGMLQTLDPHSSFMDPRSYARMRSSRRAATTASACRSSPSTATSRSPRVRGLARVSAGRPPRRCDRRDRRHQREGWTTDEAVRKLRGPKGTFVNIAIRRKSLDDHPDESDARRDQHSERQGRLHDRLADRLREGRRLCGAPDEDLGKALDQMTAKGMKRLVFDLRGNPGGQLDQAIRITNRFVPKGSMIVYTRGRVNNADQDYRAMDNGDHLDLPMVVLVNRNSASASKSSPARCRITIAPTSSERRLSARRWCSRSIA